MQIDRETLMEVEAALEPFVDCAGANAADAPEWRDHDAVRAVIKIGSLRAATAALARLRKAMEDKQ